MLGTREFRKLSEFRALEETLALAEIFEEFIIHRWRLILRAN